jgi:phosphomevalonate kinase
MTAVRVPGKVMLSGEYAVLYGATAVLVPVPRHLTATAAGTPPEVPYSPVIQAARRVSIPELQDFESAHGVPHLQTDDSAFFATDSDGRKAKLGLGLSAAEAVATVALRYACAGRDWQAGRASLLEHALAAHSQAQQGLGSGADVAACASGAPIRFRRTSLGPVVTPIAPAELACCPPLALHWSGQAADTRALVRRFDDWAAAAAAKPLLDHLAMAADALAPAWFSEPEPQLFALLDEFTVAMEACAEAAGIPYLLPAHARLASWAMRHGGRAKPTGAGGGDMVLLIGDLPLSQLGGLTIELSPPYSGAV